MAKKRRIEAAEFELRNEDGNEMERSAKEKVVQKDLELVAKGLRDNEKARQATFTELWRIRQDHFPELELCDNPWISEEVSAIFSEYRSLDMYTEIQCIRDGRHKIWKAKFDGNFCVLKQFSSEAEMFREAKIQYRMRHDTIAPIQAVFHCKEKGTCILGSYVGNSMFYITLYGSNTSRVCRVISDVVRWKRDAKH